MPHGNADPPRELVAPPSKDCVRHAEGWRESSVGVLRQGCGSMHHRCSRHARCNGDFHVRGVRQRCHCTTSTVVKHPAVPSLHPLLSSHQLPSPGPTFHRHGCHSSNTTDAVLPFCDRHRLFKAKATETCGPAPHASAPRLILPLSELNTSFVPQCWKHHSESSSLLARRWQPNVHVSLDGVQLLRPIR
jgi:hypothetical protein